MLTYASTRAFTGRLKNSSQKHENLKFWTTILANFRKNTVLTLKNFI